MKRTINLYLNDILESINLIDNSTKNLTKNAFDKDRDIQDATIRRIEIIGEAVKNVPESFRKKYPKIEWKKIAGTRDILSHVYFGVNMDKIWEVVKDDLPKLKKELKKILEAESKKES